MMPQSYSVKEMVQFTLWFLLLIWTIAIANLYVGYLNDYGIQPRQRIGLIGIVLHPFLHANLDVNAQHLINNSLFLSFLLPITLFVYQKRAKWIILAIILLTGSLVWLMGRPYNHVGASGLIFGLLAALMTNAFFQRNLKALFSLILLLLAYGVVTSGFIPREVSNFWQLFQALISNIFYSILPGEGLSSWESHFFGTLSGILVACQYRQYRFT